MYHVRCVDIYWDEVLLVTVVVVDEPSLVVVVVVEVDVTVGLCDAGRIIGSSTHLPVDNAGTKHAQDLDRAICAH